MCPSNGLGDGGESLSLRRNIMLVDVFDYHYTIAPKNADCANAI